MMAAIEDLIVAGKKRKLQQQMQPKLPP